MNDLATLAPSWTLHCGDCLDILATQPEASIDVVVTSPPYNLALAYQRSGQLKQAEQAYLQAASTDPNDGDVLYALAAFYYQGRHYAQALPWFQRFADQNPNDPRVPPLRQALAQSGLK